MIRGNEGHWGRDYTYGPGRIWGRGRIEREKEDTRRIRGYGEREDMGADGKNDGRVQIWVDMGERRVDTGTEEGYGYRGRIRIQRKDTGAEEGYGDRGRILVGRGRILGAEEGYLGTEEGYRDRGRIRGQRKDTGTEEGYRDIGRILGQRKDTVGRDVALRAVSKV